MLDQISTDFRLLAKGPPALQADIDSVDAYFGKTPDEYRQLVAEATEIELQHSNGQYIRIWGPNGCIEMDEGYGIRQRIADAIPIGDDGGGHVIFYANGKEGVGLYHVGYGNLDLSDGIWIASSLREFLTTATGIHTF